MKLNDKVYDVLKWIALIVLPAIETLYAALAGLWGLPYSSAVVGTIAAVNAFLGALIGVSTATYNKEQIESEKGEE